MESTFEVKHYDKVFGNCEIFWKIEDFILAISDESSNLQSSEFYVSGPKPTKWMLIFIPKQPTSAFMRLYLKRLNDSGPKCVSVDWSLNVGSLTEKFYYSEHKHDFEIFSKVGTDISDLYKVLSTFEPFDCDTLLIRCHLIVTYRDITISLTDPESFGLRCLSKDLGMMFQITKDKDLILKVDNNDISVHKAVVSRNSVLRKLVYNRKVSSVELPHLNSEAVKKYVHYLYTGDLDKILQNPSIAMYKCLKVLDTVLLKRCFALEELKLHTKVNVDEFEHLWIIRNFSSREDTILSSPPFKQTDLDTTWQLTIYLHGIDDNDSLSIFADVVDGNKPKNVCLEFAVEDSEGETYYPRRILSHNGSYDIGIKDFVNKDYLSNTSLVVDDTLNLAFKVRTWDNGEYYSTTGSRMICFKTATTERSSYFELSKGLLNVYRSGIHTDITIVAVEVRFEAHRCILSARSSVLSSMIEKMTRKNVLTLNDITPVILNLLLVYIYCGNLLNIDNQTLVMLCKAAETYGIASLVLECKQALQKASQI